MFRIVSSSAPCASAPGGRGARVRPSRCDGDPGSLSGRRSRLASELLPDGAQLIDFSLLGVYDLLRELLDLRMRGLLQRGLGCHDRHLMVGDGEIDKGQIGIVSTTEAGD